MSLDVGQTIVTHSLANADFETGTTTGWTQESGTQSVTVTDFAAYAGSYYLSWTTTGDAVSSQRVDLVAAGWTTTELDSGDLGAWLEAYGRVESSTAGRNEGWVGVRCLDSTQTPIGSDQYGAVFASTAWAVRSMGMRFPSGTRYVDILLKKWSSSDIYKIGFDNVVLKTGTWVMPVTRLYQSAIETVSATTVPSASLYQFALESLTQPIPPAALYQLAVEVMTPNITPVSGSSVTQANTTSQASVTSTAATQVSGSSVTQANTTSEAAAGDPPPEVRTYHLPVEVLSTPSTIPVRTYQLPVEVLSTPSVIPVRTYQQVVEVLTKTVILVQVEASPVTQANPVSQGAIAPFIPYAPPDSDVAQGAWTPATGTVLVEMVDEYTPQDTDYIYTDTPSVCEMTVGVMSDPGTSIEHSVEFRVASDDGSTVKVTVKQGATVIATRTYTNLSASYTDISMELTEGEADLITDYTALSIVLEAIEA